MKSKNPEKLAHELAEAVLEWWEIHESDTDIDEDGNESPHYTHTPEFVYLAQEFLGEEEK